MLVWGGNRTEDEGFSDGAAYDPASDTWRTIAHAPIEWHYYATSAWTGTEWWIAAAETDGGTVVAAYDPVADSWRSMPSIPDEWADTPQIAWTGSEIVLLTAAGLFEMSPADSQWIAHGTVDLHEPTVWTGDLFVGMGTVPGSPDPLDGSYLSLPIGWNPATDEQVGLPPPPRSVYEHLVLADNHLAYFESGLAFDLADGRWLELDISPKGQTALGMVDTTQVWAGDRLIVWGGEQPCFDFGPDENNTDIFEFVPDWSAAQGQAAESTDEKRGSPAIKKFAC
jgi:hypothetical protein